MNWFTKLIAWIFGIEPVIDNLKKLAANQDRQIETIKGSLYVPVQAPIGKELAEFNLSLSEISKNKHFTFYLHAIETEIIQALRECPLDKVEDISFQMRGALQIIDRIRYDLKYAETGLRNQPTEDPDIILKRLETFTTGSRN